MTPLQLYPDDQNIDQSQHSINYSDPIDPNLSFEAAWRCASIVEDSWPDKEYDIPPDHYRYTINTEEHELPPSIVGISDATYYSGIGAKTTIYNFYNPVDSALEGWHLQQVSKPDSGRVLVGSGADPTSGWFYKAVSADTDGMAEYEACILLAVLDPDELAQCEANKPPLAPVRDIYTRDNTELE